MLFSVPPKWSSRQVRAAQKLESLRITRLIIRLDIRRITITFRVEIPTAFLRGSDRQRNLIQWVVILLYRLVLEERKT